MNKRNFERQLEQIAAPLPDAAARQRARQAALAQFQRLHPAMAERSMRRWQITRPWTSGLAAAAVAVLGVAIVWNMPQAQRQLPIAAGEPTQAAAARIALDGAEANVAGAAPAAAPQSVQEPAVPALPRGELPAPRPVASATSASDVTPAVIADDAAQDPLAAPTSKPALLAATGTDALSAIAAAPIATITREQMERLGVISQADALAQLTPRQVAGPEDDRQSYFNGNTIANLRGQDPAFGTRTLTLVDGRRPAGADIQTGATNAANSGGAIIASSLLNARYQVAPAPPVTGDRFGQVETNPVKRTADESVSTFSIDVDTASYSFVRRMLDQGTLPQADAVRVEEMVNYFDYAWPAASSRSVPFRPTVTVSDSPWGAGRKLVHVGIKGYEVPRRSRPDVNLVLLLDVSGSMNSADKLPLAQQSIRLLLDSLKPSDTVAIAVYAGAAGEVLAPTPVRERERIERAIDGLRAGGSTAGAQGIRLAYELAQRGFREGGVNRILLATDGDFNVGTSSTEELKRLVERERQRGIHLSVLGFGQGNYRDDIAQTLAQNGNGVAAYIDTLAEARKVLVEQAGAALFTIASDVKIQVEFNPATVAEYRLVGYETRALNREDFNNDRIDAGEVGSGHTVTAIYEITPVGSGATLIDERRYAAERTDVRVAEGRMDEYGYLKIRYKLPGEENSRLLEQAIRTDAGVPRQLRQEVAFSTAVAGFAQLLRGGEYTGSLGYEDVIAQASPALGEDPHEYRAGFLQLVRKAQQIRDSAANAVPRSLF